MEEHSSANPKVSGSMASWVMMRHVLCISLLERSTTYQGYGCIGLLSPIQKEKGAIPGILVFSLNNSDPTRDLVTLGGND